jgi:nucleotide-binding universal stress UspA family protein
MTSTWKILAPVDLSRPAEDDVRYALSIATAFRADLHLAYILDSESSHGLAPGWPADALNIADSEVDIHRAVLHGAIARTITEHANTLDADLVLMPSRRYGSWKRFWRKSVTDEVMQLSRRLVCVTSATAIDEDFRFRKYQIMCVVGLDGRETMLIRHAENMAVSTGAELVLLHIVPEPSEALLYHAIDGGSRPLSRERAARDLADMARGLRVPATTSVMVGDADKCVGLAAREHSVDLVLVSRGRLEVPAAYGAEVERLSRTLRCPLVTVPVDGRRSLQRIDEIRPPAQSRGYQMDRVATSGSRSPMGSAVSALRRHLQSRRPFDAVRLQLWPADMRK